MAITLVPFDRTIIAVEDIEFCETRNGQKEAHENNKILKSSATIARVYTRGSGFALQQSLKSEH